MSLSAIAIVAEKKEGKDVKNPKSTKGKQPCVTHVPRCIASRQRTKISMRLTLRTDPGITPMCTTLKMSPKLNRRQLTWCDIAATWFGGVVGLSWGDGGMGMRSSGVLSDPQRLDEQVLQSTVKVNFRVRATLAMSHTLQASHFMGPLFRVTPLPCSIRAQVASWLKATMMNKDE